jgi:hypothetical protein
MSRPQRQQAIDDYIAYAWPLNFSIERIAGHVGMTAHQVQVAAAAIGLKSRPHDPHYLPPHGPAPLLDKRAPPLDSVLMAH